MNMSQSILKYADDHLAWAAYKDWLLERGEEWKQPTITSPAGIKLALIPAGTFLMGSPYTEEGRYTDEGPQHLVTITKPFYQGIYPVTQRQWQAVMGNNPSKFKGENLPVEQVSWYDVQEFLQKLNDREKDSGWLYRLPTEAEWEYACRAGTQTRWSFGDDESKLNEYAWFDANSKGITHPVGRKKANHWGLHDMHGNVWEWCDDWYSRYYYGKESLHDPVGPPQGSFRVIRGGSWYDYGHICRAAYRFGFEPGYRVNDLGFRLVANWIPTI